MRKNIVFIMAILVGLMLSGCNAKKEIVTQVTQEEKPVNEIPADINYIFLVELTKNTKIAFSEPVKSDIIWTEGDTLSTRKTFFGDSYLISYSNPAAEDEKTVENYFKENNFVYMKFNESKGEDSHKVGYRKDNLVCKYDWDKYPDEEVPHLIVYCSDASKGTERK